MFKKVTLMMLSAFLFGGGLAFAGNADTQSDSAAKEAIYDQDSSTYVFRVSSGGHITNHTRTGELGSPTAKWSKFYLADSGLIVSTGVSRNFDFFLDLPAKSRNSIMSGAAIATGTLVSAGTTYIASDMIQPTVPRNIVILSTTVSLIGQATMTVSGTCFVQGINSVGISTNEYVTLVSTADAAAGRGNVAWSYISSVTLSGVTFGGVAEPTVKIFIGTSDKIGMTNHIASTNDIYHVSEAGIAISSYTASAVYDTVTFTTTPNGGNDYSIRSVQRYFTPLP